MKEISPRPQPVKNFSLAEQVEESLMRYLKENRFKTGDPLPKETELAEYLGVSRNIVREALSRLRMLGIIESKKRKGMIISEPDLLGGVERVMDPDLLGEKAMQNIFELRLVLEVGMSDLLFIRKKPEDVKILQDIAKREAADPLCAGSIKTRLGYEIEFHSHLYQMSGNDTLNRFQSLLLPVFHYMMEQEAKLQKKPEKGSISHFDLVETLRSGTANDFRGNMREHLTPHYRKLEVKEADKK
ncbi:MAG: GntR family transcriptional regulator [Marinoscillum sp.]